MFQRTMIGLAGILFVAFAAGCKKSDTTGATGAESKKDGAAADPKKEAAAPLGKPDVTMDAVAWHAEFKKDNKAAKQKYKGKVVELTGTVRDLTDDPYGNVGYIYLEVKGDILGVRVATKDKKPWLTVAQGSQIKVKGKEPEAGLPADLFEAEIVDAGPNPAMLSAEQLAKEYTADRKATAAKYNEKRVNVEGEVVEKGKSQYCDVQLKLKGAGEITISCCFGGAANTQGLGAAKPGQKLKVFGTLSLLDNPNEKVIHLNTCALTELQ
jgi:hypothetical protein